MTEDIEPLDDDIVEHLKSQGSQRRRHATFFTWHDRSAQGKGMAEAGIVDDLLSAMQAEGQAEYRSLGASGEQWPDVWLESSGGQRVPCEVTELVDTGALPAGVSRSEVVTELVESLQSILNRKGLRSFGGASGTQSVLVIHTDEFYLNAVCALAGADCRPTSLRRWAGRPQLKRDPLGRANPDSAHAQTTLPPRSRPPRAPFHENRASRGRLARLASASGQVVDNVSSPGSSPLHSLSRASMGPLAATRVSSA